VTVDPTATAISRKNSPIFKPIGCCKVQSRFESRRVSESTRLTVALLARLLKPHPARISYERVAWEWTIADVVDLAKDPVHQGSLARSTTPVIGRSFLRLNCLNPRLCRFSHGALFMVECSLGIRASRIVRQAKLPCRNRDYL